jgi:ATP-dependent Lon protease
MATALFSLLTGRKIRYRLAMTGELSLTGKVLPVGGIKEKLLAARRAGVTTVILPKLNEKDLLEVPEYATRGMTIHFVSRVEEVFALALDKHGSSRVRAAGVKKVLRPKNRVKTKTRSKSGSTARAH